MDVNKILEMLEREDKPMAPRKREQVAKESVVRACNGSYDDINRLLEEDIAIDEKMYRQSRSIARPSKESLQSSNEEDGGATAVTVENPIPSPVMKKKATEETDCNNCKEFEKNGKKYKVSYGKGENGEFKITDIMEVSEEAFAGESTTEKSPMKGTTDDIVKSKPIDFKSKNNGFETDVSKETGKANAMNEKQTIKAAGEELIETKKESVFPESFEFDEEAFAELFGLNPEEVSGTYVEEDDNVPEHVEIRFKEGENDVLLKYMDDGSIIEEVNAEVVETPRFSASMEQDDEGNFLLLISSADDLGDGTDIPKSEGEGDATDEGGQDGTKEFVEEAGLDLDAEYSDDHRIKPAKNAADKIKDPTVLPVHESADKPRRPRARAKASK